MHFEELRKKKGYTQATLAKALEVDQSTVCLWEKGKTFPRADIVFKLAELFECSIDEIYISIRRC